MGPLAVPRPTNSVLGAFAVDTTFIKITSLSSIVLPEAANLPPGVFLDETVLGLNPFAMVVDVLYRIGFLTGDLVVLYNDAQIGFLITPRRSAVGLMVVNIWRGGSRAAQTVGVLVNFELFWK